MVHDHKVMEHIWLRIFFQIISGPGPSRLLVVQDHMVLDGAYGPVAYGPGACVPGP